MANGIFGAVAGGALKNNPIAQANDLAGQYQREGFFNPYGSPRLRALRRRAALQRRQAMMQANQGAAQLYGLDPMQQRAALAQGNVYGNAQTSGDLANADLQTEMGQDQFGKSLFMGNLDYARQRQLQREQQKAAEKGAMGSILGGLAGSALNFIPGIGPAAGAVAGAAGASRGGSRYSSNYNPYDYPGF